jgi:Zn-dependent M28 family amino/carboxypeptidase
MVGTGLVLVAWLAPAQVVDSVAARLVGAALVGGGAYETARGLTDRVGPRLTGSDGAARGVEWALGELRAAGLTNVHTEPVRVERWIRGDAAAEVLAPNRHPLHAVALGGSVGTASAGIAGEVVEVRSFEELSAQGSAVRGKIVLFNRPVTRGGEGYGQVVPLRHGGAVAAARAGAIAALIRSVGTGAYQLPHTGATEYADGVAKIPFAAITAEDAELMHRLAQSGPVRVRLRLGAKMAGTVESANVVGEVRGREQPRKIVLLGAHLDSWDLGTGALDDAAGCAIVIEAARLIAHLGAAPRRTVRVVLFMNEERGLSGAKAYAERHRGELGDHAAALEADTGAGKPLGFGVVGGAESVALVQRLVAPLAPMHLGEVKTHRSGGADVSPLQAAGVPILDVTQDGSTYFDWHHTAADTLDKIDPNDLALSAGAVAVLAHALADSTLELPRGEPPRDSESR